jgi:signal transduction histidine kinase
VLPEAERQDAIEAIYRNAQVQARLIEDIIDVSRIVTGKLRLDVQPTELAPIIEAAVESVSPAAEARNIRLQRVLDSGPSMVSGDPNRLQQVVWNLLTNAIKFTPKGGRVQSVLERVNSHVESCRYRSGEGIAP